MLPLSIYSTSATSHTPTHFTLSALKINHQKMAAKRFFNDSNQDPDKPSDKRMRNNRPSFASVIGEVVMMKNLENLFSAMEPSLKRVVGEEVERVMRQYWSRSFTRSPSLRLQAMEQPSSLQLWFNKRLSLPIFTGTRILDIEGSPINIVLMDKSNGQVVPTSLPHALKLEIVVLDGDFPPFENEDWMSEEFNRSIVKERSGKRPLLAGEMNLTMRDGIAVIGDIEFTDNSSWMRCRKFRVAVRVALGSNQGGVRIREAVTEAFVVKDHRGELYKKHRPPMLHDDVWRLEKIGKDGAFHRKLSSEGIKTVQDFLKLAVVDTLKLRNILGIGMSDRMWDVTIKHAMTCDMGSKLYIYRGPQFTIFLDPVCKLIRADINGQTISTRDPMGHLNRAYIERLVREAYARWHNLEEIDGVLNNIALLTQGDQTVEQFPNNQPAAASVVTYDQNQYYSDKSASYVANNSTEVGCCEWSLNQAYSTAPFAHGFPLSFSVSQSDGDITASGSGSLDIDEATRQN